jgi:hypothetical protein
MGAAAIGLGGRSSGGGSGLAVLRCKGLPPSDFKHLARTVLSLDLHDEELGAVVAKYVLELEIHVLGYTDSKPLICCVISHYLNSPLFVSLCSIFFP